MSSLILWATALYAIAVNASPLKTPRSDNPTAVIDTGAVQGITTNLPSSDIAINKFLGIPFGAPPKRFSPPESAPAWHDVYDASDFKPACIQKFNYPEKTHERLIKNANTPPPPAGESEDCLNLNVYSPAGAAPGSKAVLFWIYGGSFSYGSGSLPMYDGTQLAIREDVVVVTSNYRTNIFGFPGSPDLPKGENNLAFLDQRLALDWVQRNIVAFGGDPRRVTIIGESAGASSVDALITAPPSPVPFHGAILQSGGVTGGDALSVDATNSTDSWLRAVEAAQCSGDDALQCMRGLPVEKLKDIVEKKALDFGPIADSGITLSNHPRLARINSKNDTSLVARVPTLMGNTADEGRLEQLKGINFEDALSQLVPSGSVPQEFIDQLKKAYAIGSPGIYNEFDQIATFVTEFGSQCQIKLFSEDGAEAGIPTWRFLYNASFANTETFPGSGAYHGSELTILFGTYPEDGSTEFQSEVSKQMQDSWGAFVRDPSNGPGWDTVPKVGVIGDGVRPDNNISEPKAFAAVDSDDIDVRCQLFNDFYSKATLGN